MMKKLLSLLTLVMLGISSVWADGYRVGFDTSLELSNAARRINTVKINDEAKALEADNHMYRDLHETVIFEVAAGETLIPGFVLNNGGWMHGLVFVDLNQNGDFATYDGETFTLDEGENVANSASSGNLGSTFSCGSFTAPSVVGDYRMRFKVDWNGDDPRALNPAGRIGNNGTYASNDGNSIVANSGSIVDVTLRVVAKTIYTITFNFEGVATGTKTVEVTEGNTPALPVTIPSYVNSTISPDLAAATGNATYTVTTSYNSTIPFTPNDESNYNLNINRSPNLKVYTEGEAIKTVAGTAITYENQDNFKWQFDGDWLNGFTLKNKAAGKYVTFGSANPANKYTATLTETPAAGAYYDLIINGDKNYFKIHGTTTDAYISNNGGAGTTFLTNWNSSGNIGDAGAQFLISEAEDIVFDLTAVKEAALETLESRIPALYTTADVEEATTAINAVTCGADQASINAAIATINAAKTAFMKKAEGKKVAIKSLGSYSTRGADYYLTAEAAGTQMTANTELTKYSVYELTYNEGAAAYIVKAIGNNTYLPKTGNYSNAIATTDDAANAGLYTITGTDEADQRTTITCINGNGSDLEYYRGIHLDGSHNIVVWGSNGLASKWNIETVTDEQWTELTATPNWDGLADAIDAADQFNIGTSLGQYNADGFVDALATAKTMLEERTASIEEVDEAIAAIATNKLTLNMPKEGQFFRIKASSAWINTPTYLKGTQNASNRAEFTQDNDEITGTETIFCYYWEGAGKYLVNYGNGMTAANNSNFMGMKQYPSTTAIAFQAATTGDKVGKYNIKFAGSRFLYTNAGLYADAGSGSTAEGYNYELEEVNTLPVAVSAAEYATLYAPVALEIPENVTAYTLAEDGDYLLASEVDGIIPANTGVVLKAAEGTYNFNVTTGGTGTSCLKGFVPTKAKPDGAYTLANGTDGIGFYSYNGATLKGFRAYFEKAGDARSFGVIFGEETGIKNVELNSNANAVIYNLAGQRVNKAEKGIYIINGKKVLK